MTIMSQLLIYLEGFFFLFLPQKKKRLTFHVNSTAASAMRLSQTGSWSCLTALLCLPPPLRVLKRSCVALQLLLPASVYAGIFPLIRTV